MAIDLITGHQGQLHISAEQIATLNNAALNGFGDHKVLRMVDGAVSYSGLAISVGTGYWRVNGFDMEIYESENVYIDPSTIGTSRIDRVFVEILQDIPSGVQRSELVVVMGEESANTPIAPDAPTDPELNTDLMLQCEEVCVATVTEGAMTLSDSTIAFNVVTPAELATVDTKVDNALGMIQKSSDAYSDSSPYKVGDYVIHDSKVYICTTACVAGSWATNSGYFTETSLTTAVTDLNSALILDYANMVDLKNILTAVNDSYMCPKRGRVVITMVSTNADGSGMTNFGVDHSGIIERMYINTTLSGYVPIYLSFPVNKGEVLTVSYFKNVRSYQMTFIPYGG